MAYQHCLFARPQLRWSNTAAPGCFIRVKQHPSKLHYGTQNCQLKNKATVVCQASSLSPSEQVFESKSNSMVTALKNFPWERVIIRSIERTLDLLWVPVKWLTIPVLALSTLSEVLYTFTVKKDLFIPLGIIIGVVIAKVVGNASLDVLKELQDKSVPWPLAAMAFFFVLLKLPGPYYPTWAAALLPHVANGGLVQTILLYRQWKQTSL